MMSPEDKAVARAEIHESMRITYYFTKCVGIFLEDDSTLIGKIKSYGLFTIASLSLLALVVGDSATAIIQLSKTKSLTEFIGSFHVIMYATMSFVKMLRLWHKRHEIRYLICELEALWPVHTENKESAELKKNSLAALKRSQIMYALWNEFGVWFFIITPFVIYGYHKLMGQDAVLNTIWPVTYPFDKHKHFVLTHTFEIYAGLMSVSSMVGSDLIFTVVSHISMLLRLLQVKIRNIGTRKYIVNNPTTSTDNEDRLMIDNKDFYDEIVGIIKIHQKLIKYQNDLEETFSMLNLINVLVSSVNICCVVFSIVLLEPWMSLSNKFFLGATLTQVGILCWFADDIFRSSVGVSDAVYESNWYKPGFSVRCRQALLLLLMRSQKPLYFTALKFKNITMLTFTSILTTSYSYFTLIYTMYTRN